MRIRMKLRREVAEGGTPPRGWRLSWYEQRRRVGVYYPAPLHAIVRAARELRYRMGAALRAPTIECARLLEMDRANRERQLMAEEFANGYMAGWRECFRTCMETIEDELTRGDDAWQAGAALTNSSVSPRQN